MILKLQGENKAFDAERPDSSASDMLLSARYEDFRRKMLGLEKQGAAECALWPAANQGTRVFGYFCWNLDEERTFGRWAALFFFFKL